MKALRWEQYKQKWDAVHLHTSKRTNGMQLHFPFGTNLCELLKCLRHGRLPQYLPVCFLLNFTCYVLHIRNLWIWMALVRNRKERGKNGILVRGRGENWNKNVTNTLMGKRNKKTNIKICRNLQENRVHEQSAVTITNCEKCKVNIKAMEVHFWMANRCT